MNLKAALTWAQKKLQDKAITSASLDAEVLLLAAVNRDCPEKKDKSWLFLHFEKYILTAAEEELFRNFIKRRAEHEPVAYLIKSKEFYGLDFFVDRNVLIPRVETEIIVEEALNIIGKTQQGHILMDVGTGSGCIPISILSTLRAGGTIDRITHTYADDISQEALHVAHKNAQRHRLASRITFLNCDLETALTKLKRKSHVILTANLPYVSPEDYAQLKPNVKNFEPALALTTDERGLYHIRRLIAKFAQISSDLGSFSLLLEADPKQMATIERLTRKHLENIEVKIIKDLRGKKRVMCIGSR